MTFEDENHEFRAWDKHRMIYFSGLTIGIEKKTTKPYVYFKDDTFNGEVRLGTHTVTQYTGIKDDDNQKIFVGDIIDNDVARFEVVFNRGCYCAHRIGTPENETELALRGVIGFRKVGNKFENPELLEVKHGK